MGLVSRIAAAIRPGRPFVSSGHLESSKGSGFTVTGGIPEIDYITELGFPAYLELFREIANDPQVAKELRSNILPLLNAEWDVEPASDDPRDVLIAEFVGANLLQMEGETFGREFWVAEPWRERLRNILTFLPFGFSLFLKVRKPAGRYTIFGSLKYLMPESVERWNFDATDRLRSVLRQYQGSDGNQVTNEEIPAEDLAVRTWEKEGSNILGRPMLRAMYKPWKFKQELEKIQLIDKQRTGIGVPFVQMQENPGPNDLTNAQKLASAMRGGNLERLWATLAFGQKMGWAEGGMSDKALPAIIQDKNMDISRAGGGQFLELGIEGSGGSRGVAGTQGAFSGILISAIGETVASQENEDVVRELVDLNFPGVKAYPKLKASKIDPLELTRNIPEFTEAITKGLDLETENEIRKRYGFMEREEGTEMPALRRQDPGANGGRPGEVDDDGEPTGDKGGAPPALSRGRVALQDEPEYLRRARIDAGRIRSELEKFESLYYGAAAAVQADMRDAVVEMVRLGALEPSAPKQVKVPFQQELRERLTAIAKSVRDFGRQQLTSEVDRQLHQLDRVRLAANPATRRGAISFANEQAEVLVELDVTGLVQRLQAQTVAEFNRLVGSGTPPAQIARELDSYLASISDQQISEMARKSTATTFNLGRNVAIQEMKAGLEAEAIRTEVMDDNTCGPCGQLNGSRVRIDSAEYLRLMPPAFCDGRQRCRGFYVVFPK